MMLEIGSLYKFNFGIMTGYERNLNYFYYQPNLNSKSIQIDAFAVLLFVGEEPDKNLDYPEYFLCFLYDNKKVYYQSALSFYFEEVKTK